ncbi:presenilins-associated rhomboid-like protein [Pyrus ussuriensis x Pyrus communis]|uniref:Presenilins-associated rhomboid-like protein n=1 Tax=Pyrus ussuriensis x Pyrus communis TaxID=2448454 RepID=A0A5N5HSA3_9ROSA|nr:presenilins-associated rhomboid-like protein [Pyrus ussuriensis x Pyrus communis]
MSQFLLQLHSLQTLTKPSKLQSIPSTCFSHHPNLTTFPQKPTIPSKLHLSLRPLLPSTARFPVVVCKSNGSGLDFDVLSQPEERGGKPHRRANGIFWIILANIGIYLADHVFQVVRHLSSNLFLYIFGRLVEEEEGNFALWLCYILIGVEANLMSWDWRKILEVLILGQFVIERVMEAAQASAALSGFVGRNSLMNVNNIAHLSGALVGVFLVWIISKVPSEPPSEEGSNFQSKTGRTRF